MGWGSSMYFTGYRQPTEWAKLGLMGDRLSFTDDEVVTKLGIGYIKDQRAECAMDTAVRYTLLNAGENGELSAKQMRNPYTRLAALVEENIIADGWYRPDATEENPHPKPVRAWVYEENLNQLWSNRISDSYSHANTHFGAGLLGKKVRARKKTNYQSFCIYQEGAYYYSKNQNPLWESDNFTTFPVAGNERALANAVDDKTVLKAINKSLNRMAKSGKAIQVTAGRGRTFRWDSWGWLDNYRQQHLVTMAKQRKLGDVVNGWEFTKGDVTNMFGVEICSHKWEPVDDVKYYRISMDYNSWCSWYSSKGHVEDKNVMLPYMFFDKAEAEAVCAELNTTSFPRNGGCIRINSQVQYPSFSVKAYNAKKNMRLEGNAEVEDYMPPQEMYKQMQLGTVERYNELKKTMNQYPNKIAGNQKQKEE